MCFIDCNYMYVFHVYVKFFGMKVSFIKRKNKYDCKNLNAYNVLFNIKLCYHMSPNAYKGRLI